MKKIIAFASMIFLSLSTLQIEANAQINVQVNIGNQPAWGPTGYDYVQFYYFPDYDFYYDINRGQYIIFRNNIWVYTNTIPSRYLFDPYNAYKVVVNQNKPYLYNNNHRNSYVQFKGQGGQQAMIRDSRDNKYYESKGHPNHNEWKANNNTANSRTNNNQEHNNRPQNGNQTDRNSGKQVGQTDGGARTSQTKTNNQAEQNKRTNNQSSRSQQNTKSR